MFLYNGSKLEKDIQDLKSNMNKSEYQKNVEPYQKEISELEKKIYEQLRDIECLSMASQDFIGSIERDYIDVIVNLDEPKAYFCSINDSVQDCKMKKIAIPIKQNLKECFVNQVLYYKNKYKIGE